MRYLLVITYVFLSTSGCAVFRGINLTGHAGVQEFLQSDFKTAFQDGELDPKTSFSSGVGFGYYGLIDQLNISWEISRTKTETKTFGVEMGTRLRSVYLDYYFNDQHPTGYFVGLGLGKLETALFGDDFSDSGTAYTVRGGYYFRTPNPVTVVFARFNITHAPNTLLKRFFFFGSSAELEHTYVGLELGFTYNLLRSAQIKSLPPAAEPTTEPIATPVTEPNTEKEVTL